MFSNIFSTKATLNLYYCLYSYFLPQKAEHYCATCEGLTEHEIKIQLKDIPKYFVMSFKRFKYSKWSSKISDQVFLPEILNLFPITGIQQQYSLHAVIEHKGYFFRGHYKVFIKKNKNWYMLDDKKVKKIPQKEVFLKQAYILMYKLKQNKPQEEKPYTNLEESKENQEDLGSPYGR